MNDEHTTPPPEDHDDQRDPMQRPKSAEEPQEALKAIPTNDSVSQRQTLPRSEKELRLIVREIVTEVLQDVEAVRNAAAEPVEVVTIPQLMIPRIRLSPMQILSAVAAAVIVIGGPITWAVWPQSVEMPDGAVGLWRTLSPAYSDRSFRITKNTLTFHVSPQDSTFHPIIRVRETEYLEEQGTTEYTVSYRHYRDEYEFAFLYSEDPDTTIRFPHQKEMTWRKGSS